MAESIIQVTSAGATKLHTFNRTIGANSVEDEVVLTGENYLASYTITTGNNLSTATAAAHLLQIMAGASLKVRVRRIEIWQTVAATTAATMPLSLIRLTSAGTGGTVANPVPLDTTDSASGATGMTIPTVKGAESVTIISAQPYMIQTIGASTNITGPLVVWDFDRPRSKPLILQAGATIGIAVSNRAAVAAAQVLIVAFIDESNF
jgi:hypothetical protein